MVQDRDSFNGHLIKNNSPAVKSKNISLCGEIMKLGALIEDPCRINFRLGPNSETPPGGRHSNRVSISSH